MTIDERIEALVKASEENRKASEEQRLSIEAHRKASEEQRIAIDGLVESTKHLEASATKQTETAAKQAQEMDKILESFREFREDRWHINQINRCEHSSKTWIACPLK